MDSHLLDNWHDFPASVQLHNKREFKERGQTHDNESLEIPPGSPV